ncbi:MAG: PAS domain-containing protein [Bacteroidota bacterium]
MKKKYILGIFIAALILVSNQIFIQYWLAQKKYDAKAINLSGRQRMLSQRINLSFYRLTEGATTVDTLQTLMEEWKTAHQSLLQGSPEVGPVEEPEARALLLQLSANIDFIDRQFTNPGIVTVSDLSAITENQSDFLRSMDRVVKLLEQDSERKLRFIVVTEILLMLLSLAVLTLEVKYIYMPIEKTLHQALFKVREQSRNKLMAIYESTIDAFLFLNNDLVVQYSNRNAKKFSQAIFSKEVEEGDYLLDAMPTALAQEMEQYYQQVLTSDTFEFEKFDGKYWWQFSLFPVYDEHKQIIGIAQNVRDITQRHALLEENRVMAQRLELIAENFPNGSISLIDQDLTILYTNGDGYRKMGVDHQTIVGQSLQSFLSPDLYEQFEQVLPDILAGQTVEFKANYQGKYFLNIMQPIPNKTNDFSRFILTSTDISQLIEYQNEILNRNQKLKEIAWMQSHEIRGPLSTIMGLVGLMLSEKEQGLNVEYLESLRVTCNHLDEAIKRIVSITNETDITESSSR